MLYAKNNSKSTEGVSSTVFDAERKRQEEANATLLTQMARRIPSVSGANLATR